jgi:hypothetical protein
MPQHVAPGWPDLISSSLGKTRVVNSGPGARLRQGLNRNLLLVVDQGGGASEFE